MSQYLSHIVLNKSLVVVFDDGQIVINAKNPSFEAIKKCLKNGKVADIKKMCDFAFRISTNSKGKFKVKDGEFVDSSGKQVPKAISKLIEDFDIKQAPLKPLNNFYKKLSENPSMNSRTQLYAFLEKNDVHITEDGFLVLYKGLTSDFKDVHTKTFSNNPGKTLKMDRKDVDDNVNNGCSAGFHAAGTYRFARDFCGGGHVVNVLVHPKNVVSVPSDCNCEKVRVCEYKVVEVVDKEIENPVLKGGYGLNQEIIDAYEAGQSMSSIAKSLSVSRHTVAKVLKSENVELREHRNQYS